MYRFRLFEAGAELTAPPSPPEGALEWVGCWRLTSRGVEEVRANLELWGGFLKEDFRRLVEEGDRLSTDLGKQWALARFDAEVDVAVGGSACGGAVVLCPWGAV